VRYEIDPYVHEEHSDEDTNVSYVCSWRIVDIQSAREVDINFHNSWVFKSCPRLFSPSQTVLAIKELQRVRGW
jgi:hypothetical protein